MTGYIARRRALSILLVAAVAGCGPRPDNSQVKLTPPVENASIGPGDVFTLEIIGEKDLPTEYQVASDGTVDLPYLNRISITGLESQEIAALVRKGLIERKVLSDPSIIVQIKAYNSKNVTLLGQVAKPGRLAYTSGLSLIQAISIAGGFNAVANRDRVNLTRKTKSGTETVTVSADAIMEGRSPDIPLQAGDQIYVPERVF